MARRTRRTRGFNAKEFLKVLLLVIICLIIAANFISSCNTRRERDERMNEKLSKHDDTVADYEEKLEEKEAKIAEQKQKNTKLKQKATKVNKDNLDVYIDIKFPFDGYYYKEEYNEVIFYEDPSCTIELSEVRFMSNSKDPDNAPNGLAIYCLRADNGKIVYCTREQEPALITEEEYNEKYAETEE